MYQKTLLMYRREQYKHYRKSKEAEGYFFCSFSEMRNDTLFNDADSDETIIDLSSLILALCKESDLIYFVEQLFSVAGGSSTYIVDVKYRDDAEYHLRNVFTNYEEIDISLPEPHDSTEDSNKNEDMRKDTVKKIIDLPESEIASFYDSFDSKLYGHSEFKRELRFLIDSFRLFNKMGEHKILSLFLMGDSGIGKTEVARALHKALKGEKKLAKISFASYSSRDALNSLIGSPLGYIGSDGGELIKRARESDTGVILIDEFEKAELPVFNYFLDVLENGKFINTNAEEHDANGYIIVFTSNANREQFMKTVSPELRSRFDYKGVFELLTDEDKKKFVLSRINEICDKYGEVTGIKISKQKRVEISKNIDYSNFFNMRDLNKKIKDTFVAYTQNRLPQNTEE
jgi:ATP-dependent Clp protease ATP-binding subunit ClpC